MDKREEDFLKRLQATFCIEVEEHVKMLTTCLIELEKNPEDKKSLELIETIFREAHSLKGAARSVNRNDIESVCQVLESIFAKLKNQQVSFTVVQFDLVLDAVKTISKMVSTGINTSDDNRELIKQLKSISEADQPKKKAEVQTKIDIKPSEKIIKDTVPAKKIPDRTELNVERLQQFETVRIHTAKLDTLFLEAEQMIQSKIAAVQRSVDLRNIYDFIGSWRTEFQKRNIAFSTDNESQLKELISRDNEKLKELESSVAVVVHNMENDNRTLGRMIDEHMELMKKVLTLPISTIAEVFPMLVRDLARGQGKEIELSIHGKEIEVDKRLLEELKDPLIHLIRNCIDHGIKKPEERRALNKPPHGIVMLNFSIVEGRNLEIIISDDGTGINLDKVKAVAVKTGIVSKDNLGKMSDQETMALVFKSGITTSKIITDISGRGLGLAIVSEKVQKLGGTVSVESQENIGTTFRIILPLTLSNFRGVMVRTGEHLFFIPSLNVERVVRVSNEEINTIKNHDTILVGQEIIVIKKLSDVMSINDRTKAISSKKGNAVTSSDFIQIIVLAQDEKRIGFIIDEVFDEHHIFVKELGSQLSRVRNISGAAVLGSGKVIPVLNVSDLMKSVMRSESSPKITENEYKEDERLYKVLVTDDSITSRSLIKNIMESAGYEVTTAVDGIDAYMKAQVGEFDLIVSDVDMPRLNGFELTAKIRSDKKLSEIPVVLVTALETREDREHGLEVGANAYLIKSSFDQSNLLEVIKTLL